MMIPARTPDVTERKTLIEFEKKKRTLRTNVPAIIRPPATNVPVRRANAASPSSMRLITSPIPGSFLAIERTVAENGAFCEIIMQPITEAKTPHAARNIGKPIPQSPRAAPSFVNEYTAPIAIAARIELT